MGAPPRFFRFMHLRIPIVEDKEESLALPARISFCRRHGDFSPDAAVSRIGPKSKWVSNRRLNCLMTWIVQEFLYLSFSVFLRPVVIYKIVTQNLPKVLHLV
jgi:hypothetical protein